VEIKVRIWMSRIRIWFYIKSLARFDRVWHSLLYLAESPDHFSLKSTIIFHLIATHVIVRKESCTCVVRLSRRLLRRAKPHFFLLHQNWIVTHWDILHGKIRLLGMPSQQFYPYFWWCWGSLINSPHHFGGVLWENSRQIALTSSKINFITNYFHHLYYEDLPAALKYSENHDTVQ
jgi:hypothetical protein